MLARVAARVAAGAGAMPQRGVLALLASCGPDGVRPRVERAEGAEGPPAGRAENGGQRQQAEASVRARVLAVRRLRGLVSLDLEPQQVMQELLCEERGGEEEELSATAGEQRGRDDLAYEESVVKGDGPAHPPPPRRTRRVGGTSQRV